MKFKQDITERMVYLEGVIKGYERRLKQLECDHEIVAQQGYDCYYDTERYFEKCNKCGKRFRNLSKKEYLDLRLKHNTETCRTEADSIEKQIRELKEK